MPRHPNNPPGPFWIDQDTCCDCETCFVEAPNNIRFDEFLRMSYVFKQPDNEEELRATREAMRCCPVEALVEES